MNYYDILLAKKLNEGSGGDITVEGLSVTENGTYTAPTGKAYSPVVVNVPLPDNAYLLKEVEGLPKDIATFTDGANLPMPSLKVSIEPIQSGSGDPSPSNIRPISGFTEGNVSVSGKNFCGELEIGTFAESSQIGSTYDEMKAENGARIRSKGLIPTFNNNIVISCDFANYQYCFCLYDANKKYLGQTDGFGSWKNVAYTPITPSSYVAIVIKRNDGAVVTSADLENCHLQVELGTTATTYEPYNGHTTTIPFLDSQGNPVEVFEGECDVVNAEDNVDAKGVYVFDGNETWTKIGSDPAYYTEIQIIKDYAKKPTSITTLCGLIAEFAKEDTYANVDNGLSADASCAIIYSNGRFVITEALYNNVSALTGKKVVFELATPSTFTSQPTSIKSIEGENNVFADTGEIEELEYFSKEV